MSKKRYFLKGKKGESAIDQALEQLRQTRAQLNESHPDLLDTMKAHIEKMERGSAVKPEITEWANMLNPSEVDLELKIDRKKNLESIMKYLEIKKVHSSEFQDQLKTVLRDTEF